MREQLLKEYRNVIGSEWINQDQEDIIQTRILYLLENQEKLEVYKDEGHLEKSLKWYVKKRSIRIFQTREKHVSLNDTETSGNILVNIPPPPSLVNVPKDYHLWKHIILAKDAKGKNLFSHRQMQIMSKRYLSGKNQVEIGKELNVSKMAISKANKAIDRKILSLDLKANVSHWYKGEGNKLPKSKIWSEKCQDTDNPHIETGKRIEYEPLDKCQDAIGNVIWFTGSLRAGSMLAYRMDPIEDTLKDKPERKMPRYAELEKSINLDIQSKRKSMLEHYKGNVDNVNSLQPWIHSNHLDSQELTKHEKDCLNI